MKRLRSLLSYGYFSTITVFVVLLLVFYLFTPNHIFVNVRNIRAISKLIPEVGIVTLGIGLLMICGEFDLSVGSILVFCSFVFIRLFQAGVNLFLVLGAVLVLGAAAGLLNGLVTVKGRIPSFITTLGAMMFWRGVTLLLSEGYTAAFDQAASSRLTAFLTGAIAGVVPVQAVWFAGFSLLLGLLLHSHRLGNWIYAAGGNPQAARAMGIPGEWVKVFCFGVVGLLCAFVGVMQLVRVSSFFSRAGDGWEMKAIAACVVGATALMGGRGSMAAILLGALIISVIENALVMLRITYFWTYMVFGLVIIGSVLSRTVVQRLRR
jgi:simple sugar transport system permease protein